MKEDQIRYVLAKNIRKLRREAHLTQDKFARKIGVSKSTISKYEKGENFFPLEKLPIIVKALDCKVDDLFEPIFKELIEEDQEYNELCKKAKNIRKYNEEWDSLKITIESLMLRVSQKTGFFDKEKRIQRGDG